MIDININQFLKGYIDAALWSTTDTRPEDTAGIDPYNLDEHFDDVSPACRKAMLDDCEDFIQCNAAKLEAFKPCNENCDDWRLGFLFWLNRSGHGSGFWDESNEHPYDVIGEELSDAAKVYGTFEIYGDFDLGVVRSHHWG